MGAMLNPIWLNLNELGSHAEFMERVDAFVAEKGHTENKLPRFLSYKANNDISGLVSANQVNARLWEVFALKERAEIAAKLAQVRAGRR